MKHIKGFPIREKDDISLMSKGKTSLTALSVAKQYPMGALAVVNVIKTAFGRGIISTLKLSTNGLRKGSLNQNYVNVVILNHLMIVPINQDNISEMLTTMNGSVGDVTWSKMAG